jgi:hypothetical protein
MTEYVFIGVIVALAIVMLILQVRKGLQGQGGSCCGQSSGCRFDAPPEQPPAQEKKPETPK